MKLEEHSSALRVGVCFKPWHLRGFEGALLSLGSQGRAGDAAASCQARLGILGAASKFLREGSGGAAAGTGQILGTPTVAQHTALTSPGGIVLRHSAPDQRCARVP